MLAQAQPEIRPSTPHAGTIRGRITDRETGQALPRFRVSVSRQPLRSENVGAIATAFTDANGAYELSNLQPGLYMVTARPPEHVATHLAQMHGYDEPLALSGNAVRSNTNVRPGDVIQIDVAMQRAFAIEGAVTTEEGDPIANAVVSIERIDRRLAPDPVLTDDFGRYRHFGLAPGRYRVCAAPGPMSGPATTGARELLLRTCNPVSDAGQAAFEVRTTDLGGAHLILRRMPRFSVSGEVFDSFGTPLDRGEITFVEAAGSTRRLLKVMRDAPGRFRIENVEAGRYTLKAVINTERGTDSRPREVGTIDVVVDNADLERVTLRTARVSAAFGVITFEGAPPPGGAAGARIRISGPTVETRPVRVDGTFEFRAVPEPVTLTLESPPAGWIVKSVQYRGRDVADQPVEIEESEDPRAIEITLTSRVGYITGRTTAEPPKGRMTLVLAFSAAKARSSARAKDSGLSPSGTVYLDANNTFKLGPLLPGEYLVVAVDRDDWFDASTENRTLAVDRVVARAERVIVDEGEQPAIAIGIAGVR